MTRRTFAALAMGLIPLSFLKPDLSSAQVTQEWVVQYDSTNGLYDCVADAALDSEGNLLLTGWSSNSYGQPFHFLTLKYSSAGEFLWAATYDTPSNFESAWVVDTDDESNVYVAGISSLTFTLIKYSAEGQQLWIAASFSGEGEHVADMALDFSGNIYLTGRVGSGFGTAKYSSEGQELWTAQYNSGGSWATSLDLDGHGNVYVTGTDSGDFLTIKYDANGQQLWTARFEGWEGLTSIARDIDVDSSGCVFITGSSVVEWNNNWDFVVIKYSPQGTLEWLAAPGLPSFQDAYFLALDGYGNCYVTGIGYTGYIGEDPIWSFLTVKYGNTGQQQWMAYFSAGDGNDEPCALETDELGNVYVAGTSYVVGAGFQMSTAKYNSAGAHLWSAFYGPFGSDLIDCSDLVLGSNGDFYLAGTRHHPYQQNDRDIVAIKYHDASVAVGRPAISPPNLFHFYAPYPNPFNSSTSLSFSLPRSSDVTLKIYGTAGELVATCLNDRLEAGLHFIKFDGSSLSTGLYICRLQAGDYSASTKLLLLK